MFKKLHFQMTFFCTFITSLILVGFSLVCLSISEQNTLKNSFVAFQNTINTMLAHLENQTTLSHQWMLNLEHANNLHLFICDNGSPLYFHTLHPHPALEEVYRQAVQIAREEYSLDLTHTNAQALLSQHTEFPLTGTDSRQYYASAALLPRDGGSLSVVALQRLDTIKAAFVGQRALFFSLDFLAICLLGIFSWLFTGRMIRPLCENKKRQMQFIASASHELRSPLTVILSSLSAMQIAKKEEAEAFLHTIQSEGERMSRLIQDMLSLASADNGSWSIHPAPIALDTLLLQTYEKFEWTARNKGLQLSVELPEYDCPPCICDGERIAQVLSILLDNAFSYTPGGGAVSLSLTKENTRWFLRVKDNGPGIHGDARTQIFERFYRADTSHKDKEHFGLGLCIASEIIKLHKGKLCLEDTPGGGATFVICLPS